MLLKLISYLSGKRIVLLEDFQGQVYKTLETKSEFGKRTAYVYWFEKVGHLTLNDDGTCSGRSYIERWKYAKGQA
jgi:hypothetical protein